uniref:Uncharacterized protein n=1 Tax=Acrobeloides nanus TaxID=290746 RepID=A0A914CL32_9BILA
MISFKEISVCLLLLAISFQPIFMAPQRNVFDALEEAIQEDGHTPDPEQPLWDNNWHDLINKEKHHFEQTGRIDKGFKVDEFVKYNPNEHSLHQA